MQRGRIPYFLSRLINFWLVPFLFPPPGSDGMTLPVQIHDSVVCSIVLGTTEHEDLIGATGIPPGSGSLESIMADHLVGTLDGAAADVIATEPRRSIVEPTTVFA